MTDSDRAFAVLATDIALLTLDETGLKVLLTTAKSETFQGQPVLPGGLVGFKERTEEAAFRILKDFIKTSDIFLEQLYTFNDPGRDPVGRVVSVAYLGLMPWSKARIAVSQNAKWESVKSLTQLAYDHNLIVEAAVNRLQGKLTYTNIVFGLMPEEFTLSELQSTYENILGRSLDKRNFRKKIGTLKILKKLAKKRKGEANRPATLYSFVSSSLREVEIL